jgi:hypothetical protein
MSVARPAQAAKSQNPPTSPPPTLIHRPPRINSTPPRPITTTIHARLCASSNHRLLPSSSFGVFVSSPVVIRVGPLFSLASLALRPPPRTRSRPIRALPVPRAHRTRAHHRPSRPYAHTLIRPNAPANPSFLAIPSVARRAKPYHRREKPHHDRNWLRPQSPDRIILREGSCGLVTVLVRCLPPPVVVSLTPPGLVRRWAGEYRAECGRLSALAGGRGGRAGRGGAGTCCLPAQPIASRRCGARPDTRRQQPLLGPSELTSSGLTSDPGTEAISVRYRPQWSSPLRTRGALIATHSLTFSTKKYDEVHIYTHTHPSIHPYIHTYSAIFPPRPWTGPLPRTTTITAPARPAQH